MKENNENNKNKTRVVYLTTVDNPYDFVKNFDSWLMFDIEKGYNTCGRLARIAKVSDEMSEKEKLIEIERAIDRIIEIDPLDLFKKVVTYED